MNRPSWMLVAVGAFALGACGKVGTLDRPAPLFGEKAKAQYRADQAAAAARARTERQAGEPEALPPDTGPDSYANPAPARTLPIQGMNPSPSGSPPPGVLPDPYANPQ